MNNDTSRKMLTRDPMITAFFAIESRDATWCVSGLEDGSEPARVWCSDIVHATEIAAVLPKYGFTDIEIHSFGPISTVEQRQTEWAPYESLADFLDPIDPSRTIEGYPAPHSALIIGRK